VFCWRQPFRAEAVGDLVDDRDAEKRRAVLFVHGFVCNRGLWNPWLTRLRRVGVPFVAVNLEPIFGSIDRYVPIIEEAMRSLHEAGHARPLIVAHSMGGLAVRAWLREHDAEDRVHSVVTIGTPHTGTVLARFGLSANTRQMRRHSQWLRDLQAAESPQRRALFTCFFGHCDNIVVPACTAQLEGADNRHIAGVAHVQMAFVPEIVDEVLARTGAIAGDTAETPVQGVADRA
jgi:triacylglycerol esterase/lipase EstA (alpha/beta hydrolase family)